MKRKINLLDMLHDDMHRYGLRFALGGFIAILAVIAMATVHSAGEPIEERVHQGGVPVAAISVVQEFGFELKRRFVGRVEATRSSAVGFESGGLLAAIGFDEGERVEAGTELARLDTARLEAQRIELMAAHKAAKAQLKLARQTLKRLETVVDRGLASEQQLDEAREQYRSADAAAELAQARTASIDVDIAKNRLTAPFDAVVTRRNVDEGKVVAAGEPVFELQELKKPRVRVGVAGPLVAAVAKGEVYVLEVYGTELEATVKAVLPLRGVGTRTVDVILTLNEANEDLRNGDLVTLQLSEAVNASGYWLPVDALAEGIRGLWTAYVLRADPKIPQANLNVTYEVVPHVVEILHVETERVFVRGGLPQGALVVGTGVHKVVPGQLVRLADETVQLAEGGPRHAIY